MVHCRRSTSVYSVIVKQKTVRHRNTDRQVHSQRLQAPREPRRRRSSGSDSPKRVQSKSDSASMIRQNSHNSTAGRSYRNGPFGSPVDILLMEIKQSLANNRLIANSDLPYGGYRSHRDPDHFVSPEQSGRPVRNSKLWREVRVLRFFRFYVLKLTCNKSRFRF